MLLQRAMIVWAIAATTLPAVGAYAAEATPAAPSPAIESPPQSLAQVPALSAPMEEFQFDAKPARLAYKVDLPAAAPRPDDFRFDFAHRQASAAAMRLSPVVSTSRTGWAYSGRVGPVRWLSPINGEGETKMRLWGRVPGQPSTPGMGTFNINLHYAFE